jgi:hypothetical protein
MAVPSVSGFAHYYTPSFGTTASHNLFKTAHIFLAPQAETRSGY